MSSSDAELFARLNNHEDNFIERKLEGFKPEDIRRAVVAFANSVPHDRTAVLFIGVGNNGEIIGVSDTDSKQKSLNKILEDCYPSILYCTEVLKKDEKHIIAVEISHSKERPHFAGAAYIRVGSESKKASDKIYKELIATHNSKAYEILEWKDKLVSVQTIDKKLGSSVSPANPGAQHRKFLECRITECDAHSVLFYDTATGRHFSEPLTNITLSKDTATLDRLLLIVKVPR